MQIYTVLSRAIGARARCEEKNNEEWVTKHTETIDEIIDSLPSGSGFDHGTELDDSSTPERIVFNTAYHHMNDGGYYDGWTERQVILTASLEMGYQLKITGRDRNDIKSYIHECFSLVLGEEEVETKSDAITL